MSLFRECFQHLYNIERKRIITPDNVVMRLNRGERPEPLPEELIRRIDDSLAWDELQQYPSYQKFYDQLSKFIGFPKEQIVVGAGIEEFIRTLMFLCCDPGQKAAVLWPTCAMYDIYAAAFGVDLVRIKPTPGVEFDVKRLILAIPDDTRLVFIPNPGQPVETYFTPGQLAFLASYCEQNDMVLAIDEAHYGFGAETALPLVHEFENVIVLRTFSKFFGAASIRVGFVVGQEKVIKPLDAARPSGEIAGPSMLVASVLMDNHKLLAVEAIKIAKARDWLKEAIQLLGLQAWGSYGFSILVEFKSLPQSQRVAAALATQGVYVKVGFPYPVERHILLTVGSIELAQQFFVIFEKVVREL